MEITNFSVIDPIFRNHHNLLPRNMRALIVGKSFCGKSTLLYNLLLKPWLDYENLIVFGKSLHQKEYQIIKSGFDHGFSKEQIANVFNNQVPLLEAGIDPFQAIEQYDGPKEDNITAHFFDDCDMIPDPSELDPRVKHLMVFDDCFLGKQSNQKLTTQGGGIIIVIQSFYHKIILDYLDKPYVKTATFSCYFNKTPKTLTISMLIIAPPPTYHWKNFEISANMFGKQNTLS